MDAPGPPESPPTAGAAAVLRTLALHDAATAAARIRIPMHVAAAAFDPAVPPPGQFAVANAPADKRLLVLEAGHHGYPTQRVEQDRLRRQLADFFADL